MATLEPVDLQDVGFLSLKNCCATSITLLSIHPTVGLFAQLRRGDTSFQFRMPPKDFSSFNMADIPIAGLDGTNDVFVPVIHLELSASAAQALHAQFVGALHITNLPESSDDTSRCCLSGMDFLQPAPSVTGAIKVNPHHAVVIVLNSTVAARETFKTVLHLFSVAGKMKVDPDTWNPSFCPRLLDGSDMESFLRSCGELSNVINAVRLQRIYRKSATDLPTNGAIVGGGGGTSSNNTSQAGKKRPTIVLSSPSGPVRTRSSAASSVQIVSATNGNDRRQIVKRKLDTNTTTDLTLSNDDTSGVVQQVALTNDDADDDLGPPLLCNPLPIYQRDLDCLKPGFYINDTIVDFYLKYLVEKYESKNGPGKAYAFSSLFYSQLTRPPVHNAKTQGETELAPAERRYENVRNWVRKLNRLFATDYIFIPVNVNQHWLLVIVQHVARAIVKPEPSSGAKEANSGNNNGDSTTNSQIITNIKPEEESDKSTAGMPAIVVLDSMASANPIANAHYHVARYVRQFLECDARTRNLVLESNRLRDLRPRVPQQNNATDCALYVCQFVECFLESPPLFHPPEPSPAKTSAPSTPAASTEVSVSPAQSPSRVQQQPSSSSQAGPQPLKRQNSCVVLIVRDLSDSTTTRRVVAPIPPPVPVPTSAPAWTPTPNLLSWFPTERVSKKRQEILQLLQTLISESSSKSSKLLLATSGSSLPTS